MDMVYLMSQSNANKLKNVFHEECGGSIDLALYYFYIFYFGTIMFSNVFFGIFSKTMNVNM